MYGPKLCGSLVWWISRSLLCAEGLVATLFLFVPDTMPDSSLSAFPVGNFYQSYNLLTGGGQVFLFTPRFSLYFIACALIGSGGTWIFITVFIDSSLFCHWSFITVSLYAQNF